MFDEITNAMDKIDYRATMVGDQDISYQIEKAKTLMDDFIKKFNAMRLALHNSHIECQRHAAEIAFLQESRDMWIKRARSHEDSDGYPLGEDHHE